MMINDQNVSETKNNLKKLMIDLSDVAHDCFWKGWSFISFSINVLSRKKSF